MSIWAPTKWIKQKQERGVETVLNYRFEHSSQEDDTGDDSGRGKELCVHVSIQPERTVCARAQGSQCAGDTVGSQCDWRGKERGKEQVKSKWKVGRQAVSGGGSLSSRWITIAINFFP